jgi:hypothetical protein
VQEAVHAAVQVPAGVVEGTGLGAPAIGGPSTTDSGGATPAGAATTTAGEATGASAARDGGSVEATAPLRARGGASGRRRTGPPAFEVGIGDATRAVRLGASPLSSTAQSYAIVLTVAGLVVLFLFAQQHLDRREPKLSAAPVRTDHETLEFS